MLIAGAKDRYQDYQDAGEKPFQEGLDQDDLSKLMASDKGISAKYVAIPTGQKVTKGADGQNQIETTYSLFAPLTKVPPEMISRMQAAGLDKSAPAMYNELAQAAKNGSDLDYRKIAVAQREIGKQVDFQDSLDKHRVTLETIAKDKAEEADAYIRAEEDKYKFGKERSADNGRQVYNSHFNPTTGDVNTVGLEATPADFIKNWQAAHPDKNGNPSAQVPPKAVIDAGLKKAAQDRADINGYLDGMQQFYGNELIKYGKPTKDADGNYVYTDPYAANIASIQNNVVKGIQSLHGETTPKTEQQQVVTLVTKYAQGLPPVTATYLGQVATKFPNGVDLNNALDFVQSSPITTKFTLDDKKALIAVLPQYYNELQTSQESNDQKSSAQQQQIDQQVNRIKEEQRQKANREQLASPTPPVVF